MQINARHRDNLAILLNSDRDNRDGRGSRIISQPELRILNANDLKHY